VTLRRSRTRSQQSDRLAGIVYLDAIADLEDAPRAHKAWAASQSLDTLTS
jgi:hypothetical protein